MPQYTIQSGDTLTGIAQSLGTTVSALQAANPNISDPNLIQAGATLNYAEQQAGLTDVEGMPSEIDSSAGEELQTELLQEGSYASTIERTTEGALTDVERVLLQIRQQQAEATTTALEKEKESKEAEALGLKTFREKESELDIYKRFEEETGLKEREKELTDILENIKKLQEQYITDEEALIGQSATMKTLTGKRKHLARTLDAKVSLFSASADIVTNKISSAKTRITNYFTRAKSDRDSEISRRNKLIELHDKNILSLETDQRFANESEIKILEDFNTRQEAEKGAILDLMTNPITALAIQKSAMDIDLENDSYEDIVMKIQPILAGLKAASLAPSGEKPGLTLSMEEAKRQDIIYEKDGEWIVDDLKIQDMGYSRDAFRRIVNEASLLADQLNSGTPIVTPSPTVGGTGGLVGWATGGAEETIKETYGSLRGFEKETKGRFKHWGIRTISNLLFGNK